MAGLTFDGGSVTGKLREGAEEKIWEHHRTVSGKLVRITRVTVEYELVDECRYAGLSENVKIPRLFEAEHIVVTSD